MKTLISTFVFSMALVATGFAQPMLSGKSDVCGPIGGRTQEDLSNLVALCEKGIPKVGVVSAAAIGSMLWIEVTREIADSMRADRLTTKQLVLNWMKIWKDLSDSRSVNVYVLWKEVEIAEGDTTIFSGDVVTIH